jgi:hypothetical protein
MKLELLQDKLKSKFMEILKSDQAIFNALPSDDDSFFMPSKLRLRTYCSQKTEDKRIIGYLLPPWPKLDSLRPVEGEAVGNVLRNFIKSFSRPKSPQRTDFLRFVAQLFRETRGIFGGKRNIRRSPLRRTKSSPKRKVTSTKRSKAARTPRKRKTV